MPPLNDLRQTLQNTPRHVIVFAFPSQRDESYKESSYLSNNKQIELIKQIY